MITNLFKLVDNLGDKMSMKPQKRQADNKSNYKKKLDEVGSQANFEKENVNLLKQMYVGKKNTPAGRTAGTLELDESEVDNPPILAVDREYSNESLNSDETEKQFFIDESDMETKGLNKMIDLQHTFTNPAGAKDTAPSQAVPSPVEVSANKNQKGKPSKANARQNMREVQAKVANAKNLAELMFRKRLIAREQMATVAKSAVQLDNKSFGLLKSIVEACNGTEASGRVATASVKDSGLKIPIHVSRPMVKGSKFQDEFSDAPWDGVPPVDYDHRKYTSH